MLGPKISKKISSTEEAYSIYIGILQAVTGLKLPNQEKKVLSVILANGSLTKEVRQSLLQISTKASIENVISKLRNKKLLIGDKPNSKLPELKMDEVTFSITLKPKDVSDQQTNS